MHPLLDALLGWTTALVAGLLCLGLGHALTAICGLRRAGTAVAFTAGAWCLSILLMACAFDSPLTQTEAGAVLILTSPAAVFGLRRAIRDHDGLWTRMSRKRWLWLGLLMVGLAPFLIQTLLPDTDWDAAMYHRPAARRFLERGILHVDPYRAQLNFPGAVPVLYMGFLTFRLESALTPFNFLAMAVLLVAVYEVGRQTLSRSGAGWAVALVLTTNIVLELGVDQRSDGFLALFFFAALQASLSLAREPRRVGLLPLLGAAMGMAIGTKLTGLLAIALFGIAALVVVWQRRPPKVVPWFVVALLCLTIPGGFWFVRNAVLLDNPIYPFPDQLLYYDVHQELRPFYPDFEVLYARAPKPPPGFLPDPGGQKEPGTILDLVDVFWHPERYQNKSRHWLQPLLFLAVLLPFLDRRPKTLLLAGAGILCFVGLGARAHLVRYALPAYPMLALGAAAVLTRRPPEGRWRTPWIGAVGACALWTSGLAGHNVAAQWDELASLCPLDYLLDRESGYAWRVRRGYNSDPTTGFLAHRVNLLIAEGEMDVRDTVLMLAESKVELFRCGTIPDVSAELYPFLVEYLRAGGDDRRLRANLFAMGVHYVLINRQQISWAMRGLKLDSPLQNRDYMRFAAYHAIRFGKLYGTHLLQEKDYELYRIR